MTLNAAIKIAKQKAAGNAKWIRAIDRAAAGLQSGELIVTLLAHDALVTSPNGNYRVNGSCPCAAAKNGHRGMLPPRRRPADRTMRAGDGPEDGDEAAGRRHTQH